MKDDHCYTLPIFLLLADEGVCFNFGVHVICFVRPNFNIQLLLILNFAVFWKCKVSIYKHYQVCVLIAWHNTSSKSEKRYFIKFNILILCPFISNVNKNIMNFKSISDWNVNFFYIYLNPDLFVRWMNFVYITMKIDKWLN